MHICVCLEQKKKCAFQLFCVHIEKGKSVRVPILHPHPSSLTPPSPAPAEQRQLLFVGYMLCLRLGVSFFLQMPVTQIGTLLQMCVCGQQICKAEILMLRKMLGLGSLFRSQVPFSDPFKRDS